MALGVSNKNSGKKYFCKETVYEKDPYIQFLFKFW